MQRWRWALAATTGLTIILGACGSDSGDDAGPGTCRPWLDGADDRDVVAAWADSDALADPIALIDGAEAIIGSDIRAAGSWRIPDVPVEQVNVVDGLARQDLTDDTAEVLVSKIELDYARAATEPVVLVGVSDAGAAEVLSVLDAPDGMIVAVDGCTEGGMLSQLTIRADAASVDPPRTLDDVHDGSALVAILGREASGG